jgi:hypothetical protein
MTGLLDTKRPLEFAVSRLFANTLLVAGFLTICIFNHKFN